MALVVVSTCIHTYWRGWIKCGPCRRFGVQVLCGFGDGDRISVHVFLGKMKKGRLPTLPRLPNPQDPE